jgi:N-methylhydantoinase A
MRALALQAAAHHGLDPETSRIEYGLDLRYAGQAFELPVWIEAVPHSATQLRTLFEGEHRGRYGYARAQLAVEVVNLRVRVVQPKVGAPLTPPMPAGTGAAPEWAEVHLGGQLVRAQFIAREALRVGDTVIGPAVIEEATATTLVPPNWHAICLPTGDLLLEHSA